MSPLAVKAHQVDASDVSVAGGPVLVVLDWDDTLLPTSWLVHENVLAPQREMEGGPSAGRLKCTSRGNFAASATESVRNA